MLSQDISLYLGLHIFKCSQESENMDKYCVHIYAVRKISLQIYVKHFNCQIG